LDLTDAFKEIILHESKTVIDNLDFGIKRQSSVANEVNKLERLVGRSAKHNTKTKGKAMSAASKSAIAAEFARRAKQFHAGKKPMEIELWGLFSWGEVSPYIKTGEIIPNAEFTKKNWIIWCKPSQAFFDKWIAPLLTK